MNNWKMMLYRFMQGRYGNDELSQFLMIAGLALLIGSNLLRIGVLHTISWVVLIYGYFRIMSRNIPKRQQENYKFLQLKAKFLNGKPGGGTKNWTKKKAKKQQTDYSQYQQEADVENYNYYRCRNCGQIVRVPKGKGTVKITCPECKNTFTDRT